MCDNTVNLINNKEVDVNTKIFIQYANGEQREFEVNDQSETLIKRGCKFRFNTIHPDHGEQLHVTVTPDDQYYAERLAMHSTYGA